MQIRELLAAVVALELAFSTSVEAGITFFTDRVAWEGAAGTPMFTENFSGFPFDTPFQSSPVALNGMAIQQEGTERMAWNEVDIPALQFTPNSGNSSALILTNFLEGGSSGIQVRITFTVPNMAFGFDSWSGNDGEGAVLEVFSGDSLLGSQALTGGSGDFLGYVLTDADTSTAVLLRSNRLTPGIVGERFYIDNLAGKSAITLAGDYNQNGTVDAADYVVWRKNNNTAVTLPNDSTPGTSPADYDVWRANFGQTIASGTAAVGESAVPEPSSLIYLFASLIGGMWTRRRPIAVQERQPRLDPQ